MKKLAYLPVLCLLAGFNANADIDQANYSELGDLLTTDEAVGRFDWLNKCYSGLLVEIWEKTHDTTQILTDTQKIQQLKNLWVSDQKIDEKRVNYLTYANPDFTNPYSWYAGTSADQSCSTMPAEYEPVELKTSVLNQSYCSASSLESKWEWITGVKVNDFLHESAGDDYTMVSGKALNVKANEVLDVTLTAGTSDPEFPVYMAFRVWLDLNQDGELTQTEMIHHSYVETSASFTYTIPESAEKGFTLMRVTGDYAGGYNNACRGADYGEVEDYLVNIQ